MTDWKSPVISWTLVVVIVAVAFQYYRKQNTNRRGGNRRTSASENDSAARRLIENKSKRKKEKAATTSGVSDQANSDLSEVPITSVQEASRVELQPRKQSKKQTKTAEAASSAIDVVPATSRSVNTRDEEDEVNNRDFARQLLNAKIGTKLAAPQNNAQRVRTKKQSKAEASGNLDATSTEASTNTSTAGGDADDDVSPALSPALAGVTPPIDNTGVADMLESPAPGPSVLRLTEPAQPPRPQKQPQKKPAAPELTKKQRQNKAKAEARKTEKQKAEAERRVKLEKQMHLARQAEREQEKKYASQSHSSVPSANVWAQGSEPKSSKDGLATNNSMLDTFETASDEDLAPVKSESSSAEASSNNPVVELTSTGANAHIPNGSAETNGNASNWHSDLSEEEQMKRLAEETANEKWETVPAKGRSKKPKPANVAPAEVDRQKRPFGDGDFEQAL